MIRFSHLVATVALLGVASTAARAQDQTGVAGAARAGSSTGSSAISPSQATLSKRMKRSKPAAHPRTPANQTGRGSQVAKTTGVTSNSH